MIERIQAAPVSHPFRFTVLGDTAPSVCADFDDVFVGMLRQMEELAP